MPRSTTELQSFDSQSNEESLKFFKLVEANQFFAFSKSCGDNILPSNCSACIKSPTCQVLEINGQAYGDIITKTKLTATEKKIELRSQRDGSGKFSISIAQHDMLRMLDGYDDSGD